MSEAPINEMVELARKAARRLEGTCDALYCEPAFEDAELNTDFTRELDRLVFCCTVCNWWHKQIYNATPNDSQWVCVDCNKEDAVDVEED